MASSIAQRFAPATMAEQTIMVYEQAARNVQQERSHYMSSIS
jgi:hypothetical protein